MSLSQETPPLETDDKLKDYLSRRFIDVGVELDSASKFPERKEMPYKPQFGDIHYFGDPTLHSYDSTIPLRGWYGFNEILPRTDPRTGIWVFLMTEPVATYLYVSAGYGGISLTAPVALTDMSAGYQTLPADGQVVTTPRGVTQDFANNGLRLDAEGIWLMNVGITLTHNEAASSARTFSVQLWNDTDSVEIASTLVGVAGKQNITNWSVGMMIEIPTAATEGDLLVARIGNGDTITSVILEAFQYSMHHVSNAMGLDDVSTQF